MHSRLELILKALLLYKREPDQGTINDDFMVAFIEKQLQNYKEGK